MFLKSKKDKDDPDTSLPKTKTQTETVELAKGGLWCEIYKVWNLTISLLEAIYINIIQRI